MSSSSSISPTNQKNGVDKNVFTIVVTPPAVLVRKGTGDEGNPLNESSSSNHSSSPTLGGMNRSSSSSSSRLKSGSGVGGGGGTGVERNNNTGGNNNNNNLSTMELDDDSFLDCTLNLTGSSHMLSSSSSPRINKKQRELENKVLDLEYKEQMLIEYQADQQNEIEHLSDELDEQRIEYNDILLALVEKEEGEHRTRIDSHANANSHRCKARLDALIQAELLREIFLMREELNGAWDAGFTPEDGARRMYRFGEHSLGLAPPPMEISVEGHKLTSLTAFQTLSVSASSSSSKKQVSFDLLTVDGSPDEKDATTSTLVPTTPIATTRPLGAAGVVQSQESDAQQVEFPNISRSPPATQQEWRDRMTESAARQELEGSEALAKAAIIRIWLAASLTSSSSLGGNSRLNRSDSSLNSDAISAISVATETAESLVCLFEAEEATHRQKTERLENITRSALNKQKVQTLRQQGALEKLEKRRRAEAAAEVAARAEKLIQQNDDARSLLSKTTLQERQKIRYAEERRWSMMLQREKDGRLKEAVENHRLQVEAIAADKREEVRRLRREEAAAVLTKEETSRRQQQQVQVGEQQSGPPVAQFERSGSNPLDLLVSLSWPNTPRRGQSPFGGFTSSQRQAKMKTSEDSSSPRARAPRSGSACFRNSSSARDSHIQDVARRFTGSRIATPRGGAFPIAARPVVAQPAPRRHHHGSPKGSSSSNSSPKSTTSNHRSQVVPPLLRRSGSSLAGTRPLDGEMVDEGSSSRGGSAAKASLTPKRTTKISAGSPRGTSSANKASSPRAKVFSATAGSPSSKGVVSGGRYRAPAQLGTTATFRSETHRNSHWQDLAGHPNACGVLANKK